MKTKPIEWYKNKYFKKKNNPSKTKRKTTKKKIIRNSNPYVETRKEVAE